MREEERRKKGFKEREEGGDKERGWFESKVAIQSIRRRSVTTLPMTSPPRAFFKSVLLKYQFQP